MDDTIIHIHQLTLKEKAALVEQLTHSIVIEETSSDFILQSAENKRIALLFRAFGNQFTKTAESMRKFVQKSNG